MKAALAAAALLLASGHSTAQAPRPVTAVLQQASPFTVEYYYKIKWGYFDEFMTLYRKNHLPVLRRLQETGRIIEMSAAFPVNHAGEDRRWDMRFTIVYRDVAAAHEDTPEATIRELFPDQATFKREEQRRFELLLEHMDIPVTIDDLRGWP